MLPNSHARVLVRLADSLRDFTWALGGSGALALHGIPIEPNDLDICTDRASAYRMEAFLDAPILQAVELRTSEMIRSHLGMLQVGNVPVELIGDMEIRTPDGAWPGAPDIGRYCGMVKFEAVLIPVMDLQFLRDGYERLGRTERVKQIEQFLLGGL